MLHVQLAAILSVPTYINQLRPLSRKDNAGHIFLDTFSWVSITQTVHKLLTLLEELIWESIHDTVLKFLQRKNSILNHFVCRYTVFSPQQQRIYENNTF